MLSWFWFFILPFEYSVKLTPNENARLAKTCGAEHRERAYARWLVADTVLNKRDRGGQGSLSKRVFKSGVEKSFGSKKLMNDEYPWMVIFDLQPGLCTGSLISPRHILTAAHCVTLGIEPQVEQEKCPERKLHVLPELLYYLGGNKCIDSERCNGWKKAYKMRYHEQYDGCTHENDIAIIELDENVPESEATPICMPTRHHVINTDLIAVGAGWRGPDEEDMSQESVGLQKLNVTFLRTRDKVIDVKVPLKAGICGGDSGGALIQTNGDNRFIQLGVMSHGTSCDEHFDNTEIANLPLHVHDFAFDSFTDVRKYSDWICEKTGVCQEYNGNYQGDSPFYQ